MFRNSDLSGELSQCVSGCVDNSDCDASSGFGLCSSCECVANPCPETPNDPNSDFDFPNNEMRIDSVKKTCKKRHAINGTEGETGVLPVHQSSL